MYMCGNVTQIERLLVFVGLCLLCLCHFGLKSITPQKLQHVNLSMPVGLQGCVDQVQEGIEALKAANVLLNGSIPPQLLCACDGLHYTPDLKLLPDVGFFFKTSVNTEHTRLKGLKSTWGRHVYNQVTFGGMNLTTSCIS